MDPKYISEVWQSLSVLSDAQEFLGKESFTYLDLETRTARANERINHAKRHLAQALEWWSRDHQEPFVRAIMLMECTLPGEGNNGTHQALQEN